MSKQPGQAPEDDMHKMAGELPGLYREISGETPSAAHDDAILAAARAELKESAKPARQPWLLRWKLPLAFAATVMLTTTLTLTVEREQSRQREMEVPLPAEVKILPDSTSPAPAPAASPVPSASPAAVPPATVDSAPGKQETIAPDAARSDLARQRKADAEPPPPKLVTPAPEAKPVQIFVPEPRLAAPASGSLNSALPPPVLQQAAPAVSGAPMRDAERANSAPLREQRTVLPEPPAKPAMAPPPPPAPAPAPKAAASEDRIGPAATPSAEKIQLFRNKEAPAGAAASADKAVAAPQDAQPLRKQRAASEAQREATGAAKTLRSPQEWISEIRALRQAGRTAEAQSALQQLKAAYPDFVLPDDLREKP